MIELITQLHNDEVLRFHYNPDNGIVTMSILKSGFPDNFYEQKTFHQDCHPSNIKKLFKECLDSIRKQAED